MSKGDSVGGEPAVAFSVADVEIERYAADVETALRIAFLHYRGPTGADFGKGDYSGAGRLQVEHQETD